MKKLSQRETPSDKTTTFNKVRNVEVESQKKKLLVLIRKIKRLDKVNKDAIIPRAKGSAKRDKNVKSRNKIIFVFIIRTPIFNIISIQYLLRKSGKTLYQNE